MNLVRNKVFALIMSFLTFISSTGFAVDVHICGDEIKSFSIFGEAEACEMENVSSSNELYELPPCHQKKLAEKQCSNKNHPTYQTKGCCHNETLAFNVDGNQNLELNSTHTTEIPSHIIQNITEARLAVVSSNFELISFFYSPPIFSTDFSVLYQVFRI